jgi:hypothetical protein
MNQNQTESKPPSVEEPREEGLDETTCSQCAEWRQLADDVMNTLRITREKYGIGDRHVTREKNRELTEAWHLLNVLSLNMMDDGPTWPRVLEWLRRNEQYRPANS